MFRVWYSDEGFGEYIVENTTLSEVGDLEWSKIFESDASRPKNFHATPDHIKSILYLDAPDLIVERDGEPLFSIEVSTEAGTGHNAFQRFGRISAAVENGVPCFYIYPFGAYITRQRDEGRWDKINPNIFNAMESMMRIYDIPALLFYFPTTYPEVPDTGKGMKFDEEWHGCPSREDEEMRHLFNVINLTIERELGTRNDSVSLLNERPIQERRDWMNEEFVERGGRERQWSPDTATVEVPTEALVDYLRHFVSEDYEFGFLPHTRERTLIYKVRAKFRGDPYPGALAALDYLHTRTGKSYEERDKNLVIAFGDLNYDVDSGEIKIDGVTSRGNDIEIDQMISKINKVAEGNKFTLDEKFSDLKNWEIPRYYMQTRHGTTYTLRKDVRMYSYFADAILFEDGALWREG